MKNLKLLFTTLLLLCSIVVSAHDLVFNDVYYKITDYETRTVEVTFKGNSYYEYSNEYSGDIVIKDRFIYGETLYYVTSIGDYAFAECSGLTSVTIPNSVTSIGDYAFYGCSGLTSVTIGNSVTSIGEGVFWGCSGLTSITIPNGVTSIGNCAFYNCSGLTSIEIPNSVTSIGINSFSGCSSLTSIIVDASNTVYDSRENSNAIIETATNTLIAGFKSTIIPNNVTSIGEYAFYNCSGLTSIEIPNSVTNIGNSAFEGCSGLTSITIPNSVTSIGSSAFFGCSGLTSIEIPNSVTSIGDGAFIGCSGFKSIIVDASNTVYDSRENSNAIIETATNTLVVGCKNTEIPNSVTSIGIYAFRNCSGLTSIEIPNSVTSIGNSAFYGCSGLASIEIPNSVTSIGNSAFAYSGWYDNQPDGLLVLDGWLLGYKGKAPTGDLIIPNNVKGIADGAFSYCSGLTSVTILDGVTSIGVGAFSGCSGLTSVTIGNSVTSIGDAAFYYCRGLTSIEIPNSVTSIGENAFSGCSGLTSVTIGNSVTSIGESAFWGCSGLTSITIPNSVTSIGERAFYVCSGLTSITIPNSVTSIGESAFYGCDAIEKLELDCETIGSWFEYKSKSSIKEIVLGNNVTSIGDYAFSGYSGLTSVTIGNNVTSIGDYAFAECSGLTSIEIPNSVTSIGERAFFYCSGLTSIEIPNSVTSIGNGAFYVCSGLTSITIPNSVTSIGEDAFLSCSGLTSITIPNSVTSIGEGAFAGCSGLTSIEIPNSVTSIGDYAFRSCSGLTSITIPNSVTSLGNYAFDECSGLTSITIPNSVTSIGDWAFNGCVNIKTVFNASNLDIVAGAMEFGCVAYYADEVISSCTIIDGEEQDYEWLSLWGRINYIRTFYDGDWQAWYMPFDVELSDIENELEVAYLNDVHQFDDNNDGEIDRTELEIIPMVEGTLMANCPYVVRAKIQGEKSFVFEGVTVEPFNEESYDCSSMTTKFIFTGTHTFVGNDVMQNNGYYRLDNNNLVVKKDVEAVTSLSELSNNKAYTLRSVRTFLLCSDNEEVAGRICSGNGKMVGDVNQDANDANQHFRIMNIDGNYYLYSIGAGMYVSKDGTYVETPTDALTFENVGGEYQWKIGIGGNFLNSQDANRTNEGIIVDYCSTTDAGNCYTIEEVTSPLTPNRWYLSVEARNAMFKAPAQIRLFISGEENNEGGEEATIENVEMSNEEDVVYDLAGRKVENPTKGVYVINGKQVLVK